MGQIWSKAHQDRRPAHLVGALGPTPTRGLNPSGTTVIETSRIRGPNEAFNPNFVMVPIETLQPRQGGRVLGDGCELRQGEARTRRRSQDECRGRSTTRRSRASRARPPSLTRILLYSGIVALICGMVGALGYSYFFGSKSGDKSSSGERLRIE